jgi:hypothetical protein
MQRLAEQNRHHSRTSLKTVELEELMKRYCVNILFVFTEFRAQHKAGRSARLELTGAGFLPSALHVRHVGCSLGAADGP